MAAEWPPRSAPALGLGQGQVLPLPCAPTIVRDIENGPEKRSCDPARRGIEKGDGVLAAGRWKSATLIVLRHTCHFSPGLPTISRTIDIHVLVSRISRPRFVLVAQL